MIRRALWPLERQLRLLQLRWLMREVPKHDERYAVLILERAALESPDVDPASPLSLVPRQRFLCPHCGCPRLGEVARA